MWWAPQSCTFGLPSTLPPCAPPALPQIDGAHPVGCTAVSWSPAAPKGSLVSSTAPGQPVRRLASAGCDNCVKVCVCGGVCGDR